MPPPGCRVGRDERSEERPSCRPLCRYYFSFFLLHTERVKRSLREEISHDVAVHEQRINATTK